MTSYFVIYFVDPPQGGFRVMGTDAENPEDACRNFLKTFHVDEVTETPLIFNVIEIEAMEQYKVEAVGLYINVEAS